MSHNHQLRSSSGDKYEIPQYRIRRSVAAGRSGSSTARSSNFSTVAGGIQPLLPTTTSDISDEKIDNVQGGKFSSSTARELCGSGDPSKSLQFGSISPGFMDGMKFHARANSTPQNMDEHTHSLQAHHDSLRRAALTSPTPSVYKLQWQKKDAQAFDQSNPIQPHSTLKDKSDVHVPAPHSTTQKHEPLGHPVAGVSMPTPFHQPEAPVQCGDVKPQMQSLGTANSSTPMPIQTPLRMGNPPLVQQQVFVPGIQPHPMFPHGTMHQVQGSHVAPQMGNTGMSRGPQYQQQQAGKYRGPRKAEKITPNDLSERFVIIDTAEALTASNVNASHGSYPSPGRVVDRPAAWGPRAGLGSTCIDEDEKCGLEAQGQDQRLDMGHGGNVQSLRRGIGRDYSVSKDIYEKLPIWSGPMQSRGLLQRGMQRYENNSDRWQHTPSFLKGTTSAPQFPLQVMHKGSRKREEQAKRRLLKGILDKRLLKGTLDKLTPQNMENVLYQIEGVNIDDAYTLSGPMQSRGLKMGMRHYENNSDRWQHTPSFRKGTSSSPQFPLQVMHKGSRKREEQARQRLLKGILDKLTPQNLEKVLYQIERVNIHDAYTLTGLTIQIYFKAVMKPKFCDIYARLCYHLAGKLPEFSEDNKRTTFRRILLNKCQEEFERGRREPKEANIAGEGRRADRQREVEREEKQMNNIDDGAREPKEANYIAGEGDQVTQAEVKREVERRIMNVNARERKLGNIQFIGELCKVRLCPEHIVHYCTLELLGECERDSEEEELDEEGIEALCKLMITVGSTMSSKKIMDYYFEKILELSDNVTLSSRMRFLLKDTIMGHYKQRYMPIPTPFRMGNPPLVQQQVFFPGIQPHPMLPHGNMVAPQMGNLGMSRGPRDQQQQAGKYGGPRKTEKITPNDLSEGFVIASDRAEALTASNVNASHGSYPSPGRVVDRPAWGPRVGRGSSFIGEDEKCGREPHGQYLRLDIGHGGNVQGLRRYKNNSDHCRQHIPSFHYKGTTTSPQFPLQVMDKASRERVEEAQKRQLNRILDKLTPQNFGNVVLQIKQVNIDSADILSCMAAQIYDKAVARPGFCEIYAKLCYHLCGELPDFSEGDEKITFKRLLLNICQEEFERGAEREDEEANRAGEVGREEKGLKEGARERKLGNIQFIGEMYKNRMLTERVMHECIKKKLGECKGDGEEDLEVLCRLMSTVGKMMDHPKAKEHMDAYFEKMSELSDNMKLSAGMRLLLKDAVDQRNNNWASH